MTQPILLSIQVGLPQKVTDEGFTGKQLTWETGIFKSPVSGKVWLGQVNLEGDGQADLTVHGGVDKAVMAYSADHYPYWQTLIPDLPYGGFGENFTISGMDENTVCMEDVYSLGDAVIQVSQPRQPCWKLARKLKSKQLPAQVIATGFSGWYFRVLKEGYVESGIPLELVSRIQPDWSIARVNRNIYSVDEDEVDTLR